MSGFDSGVDATATHALNQLVADYGSQSLQDPRLVENHLKDFMAAHPREANVLGAAVASGATKELADNLKRGMDPDTAVELSARAISERRSIDPASATWAAGHYATALGHPPTTPPVAAGAVPWPANPVLADPGTPPAWPAAPTAASQTTQLNERAGFDDTTRVARAVGGGDQPTSVVVPTPPAYIEDPFGGTASAGYGQRTPPSGIAPLAPGAPVDPSEGDDHSRRTAIIAAVAVVAVLVVVVAVLVFALGGKSHNSAASSTTVAPASSTSAATTTTVAPTTATTATTVAATTTTASTTTTSVPVVGPGGWNFPVLITTGPTSGLSLNTLQCRTPTGCLAADGNGGVETFDGTTLSTSTNVDPHGQIQDVACPTAAFCAAVDNAGYALTETSGVWSDPLSIAGTQLNSVSCASMTMCVAVGSDGDAYVYNGTTTWATSPIDNSNGASQSLTGVSCPATTFCVAVDNVGNAFHYNGSTWTMAAVDENANSNEGNNLVAVSCPTTTFCAAVDQEGDAVLYRNGSWGDVTTVDTTNGFADVSCPVAGFCAVVDTNGQASVYQANAWGAMVRVDGNNKFLSVSCTGASYCIALDAHGNAVKRS